MRGKRKMRIKESGPKKTRTEKAIEAVQKENNYPINSHNSTKDKSARNFSFYKYTNLDNKEVSLGYEQLLSLGREYVRWAETDPKAVLKQTFWNARGINYRTVSHWCEKEPEFKRLFELGGEMMGSRREGILMEDLTHLRSRQSIYVPEYKDHDEQVIRFKAEVAQLLEQVGSRDPVAVQAAFENTLGPIMKLLEKSNETRIQASQDRAANRAESADQHRNATDIEQVI